MTATVAHLVRHPIKSAGFEELSAVTLAEGRAFPFDREWAVAHAAAKCGTEPAGWASKLNFLRGWGSADLMAVACVSDEGARRLTLTHPRATPLTLCPDDPADQPRLIDWLRPFWPSTRPEPVAVVRVPGQPMTDVPDPWVAVLNMATLRDLSAMQGRPLPIAVDQDRFLPRGRIKRRQIRRHGRLPTTAFRTRDQDGAHGLAPLAFG